MATFIQSGLQIRDLKNELRLQSANNPVKHAYLCKNVSKFLNDIFPSNFLSIESLYLDSCKIEKLHSNTFSRLVRLECLGLEYNKIKNLEDSLFSHNKHLRYLYLKNNEIGTVTFQFIKNMERIWQLDLSKNRISHFSHKESHTLSVLKLNNNILIDFECNNFPNLIQLYLSNNKVEHLSISNFSSMAFLIELYLEANNIQSMAEDTFNKLETISHIFLGSNKIQIIPDRLFGNNGALKVLDLSRNLIETISDSTFQNLKVVHTLNLSFNVLTEITPLLFRFTENLRYLNLSNNVISEIDRHSFKYLVNLREFVMNNNMANLLLKTCYFENTINLAKISITNSKITEIHYNCFRNLSKLSHLYLDSNEIKHLPPECFVPSTRHISLSFRNNQIKLLRRRNFFKNLLIEKLDFSGNSEMIVEIDAFKDLLALKTLNLSGVSFLNKPLPDLAMLKSLEIFDLRSCSIAKIPTNYFTPLKKLKKLLLDNNRDVLSSDNFTMATTSTNSPRLDSGITYKFLSDKIFSKKSHLNYLELSKCDILAICPIVLQHLDKLTYLNLNYNHLDSLDEDLLRNLLQLEELHLSHNNLRNLKLNNSSPYAELKILDLRKNRIKSLDSVLYLFPKLETLYIDKKCKIPDLYLRTNTANICIDLTKGGTWLALSTKHVHTNDVILRIGILLNINGEVKPIKAESRGLLITNYLRGDLSAIDYLNQLEESKQIYAPYNLVLIEVKMDDIRIHHKSNLVDRTPYTFHGGQLLSFGNSPVNSPYVKVSVGSDVFLKIVQRFRVSVLDNNKEIVPEMLKFLKSDKKYLPDKELLKRDPHNTLSSSSIFVKNACLKYGTRTHTIILLDGKNKLEFVEQTMVEPIAEPPKWTTTRIELSL